MNRKATRKNHTLKQAFGVLCVLAMNPVALAAGDVGALMRQGNSLYGRGKYDEALSRYGMAELLEPDATSIRFNKASALYRLGRYEDALRELELASIDKKPSRRAAALYNTGDVLFKAGQLDGAIKAYTAALVVDPKDRQAKENLEYCLRKQDEQQQQQQQNQQQQNQQQQQDQQQQPQPQQQQQGMSKDQAERILQAVQNEEKDQQEKARGAGGRRKVERDW